VHDGIRAQCHADASGGSPVAFASNASTVTPSARRPCGGRGRGRASGGVNAGCGGQIKSPMDMSAWVSTLPRAASP
jgi:hypothetical protein